MELLCVFTEPRVFDTCHTVVSTGTRRRDGGAATAGRPCWGRGSMAASVPTVAAVMLKSFDRPKIVETLELFGVVTGLRICEDDTTPAGIFNPPESARRYSEVNQYHSPGFGSARSMLDSPDVWICDNPTHHGVKVPRELMHLSPPQRSCFPCPHGFFMRP